MVTTPTLGPAHPQLIGPFSLTQTRSDMTMRRGRGQVIWVSHSCARDARPSVLIAIIAISWRDIEIRREGNRESRQAAPRSPSSGERR